MDKFLFIGLGGLLLLFVGGYLGYDIYTFNQITDFESCSKTWGSKVETLDDDFNKTCTSRNGKKIHLNGGMIIKVFFKGDAPSEQIQAAFLEIKDLSGIANIDFTSAEDALAEFKAQHAGDQSIQDALALLGENPLGANIRIEASSNTDANNLYNEITALVPEEIVNEIAWPHQYY